MNLSALKAYKLPIILASIGVFLILFGIVSSRPDESETQTPQVIVSAKKQSFPLFVHVAGAVKMQGVYQFDANARVRDAIAKAGGFSKNADLSWVERQLNLAQSLTDGSKIYIPRVGESTGGVVMGVDDMSGQKININKAPTSTLETLEGIGEKRAQKIIEGRPYSSIEELKTKKVVGQSVYEKIKDEISVF